MKGLLESIQEFQGAKYAHISWDYCSTGVWNKDGANVDADWLPVHLQTIQHIASWHTASEAYWNSRPSFDEEELPCIAEMDNGLNLWRGQVIEILKKELPDWTIE